MKIPKFNEETRTLTKDMCCGQSCLAVIESRDMKAVFKDWIDKFGWYGYSKYKDVKKYLEEKGYIVKRIKWDKLEIVNKGCFYILRVQWIGKGEKQDKPYYGWSSWFEATSNTHFIVLKESKVFCNDAGIFNYEDLSQYLDKNDGLITSALEVRK